MSSPEQFGRSPMASRRVRRHAMGVSNSQSVDNGPSSISRNTVSVIHADRLVKVPQHLRPPDPSARESRVEDRPLVTRLYDKLFKTHRERYVRKVLRSFAGDGSGLLSREQLRAALDQLHVGLERRECERIIARVAPDADSKVHYLAFMRAFEVPAPLGGAEVAVARGMSVPGPPVVRPGGGGSGVGDGGKSYWSWQRHSPQRMPGLLDQVREDSSEQVRSDALLTGLLISKLGNCRDKLRAVFRQMDTDRNSLIDREEFAQGLARLAVDVSRDQVDRLFELCDTDRNGFIDYTEFVQRFEEPGQRGPRVGGGGGGLKDCTIATATAAIDGSGCGCGCGSSSTPSSAAPLAQSLALSPDEVLGALRQPLVLELARSLHGKGSLAAAPFKQLDLPRCGRLDVAGMTAACRALVPGITERNVAAVMAAVDPTAPNHVDYRAFIARVEAGLSHPRMAHSAPPGGPKAMMTTNTTINRVTQDAATTGTAGGGGLGALARFGEPLTVPAPLPTPHTRALSAVSLSRRTDVDAVTSTAAVTSPGLAQPPPPPPAPSTNSRDRDSLYRLHATAVAPVIESLNRAAAAAGEPSLPFMTRSVDVQVGSEGTSSSTAPSHATGRFSRFWSRRYADTSSITSPEPASALATRPDGPFVRKGAASSDQYLHYQQEDRVKEARRRQQHVQRYAVRSEIDARYSAQDDASGVDDGRLAVAKASRQRYEERCEMYDRIRQMQDKGDHTFFAPLPVFREHKTDTANQPVWADQTRTYW